jgi:hypothetical protein
VGAHRLVRRRDFHIFQTIGSQMAVTLSALRAGRPPFTCREIPVGGCVDPRAHSAAGRIEKSNDRIGNRTPDLPACNMVPQPNRVMQVLLWDSRQLQLTLHPSHVKAPKWNPAAGSPHTRHNWFICKQAPAQLVTQSDRGAFHRLRRFEAGYQGDIESYYYYTWQTS